MTSKADDPTDLHTTVRLTAASLDAIVNELERTQRVTQTQLPAEAARPAHPRLVSRARPEQALLDLDDLFDAAVPAEPFGAMPVELPDELAERRRARGGKAPTRPAFPATGDVAPPAPAEVAPVALPIAPPEPSVRLESIASTRLIAIDEPIASVALAVAPPRSRLARIKRRALGAVVWFFELLARPAAALRRRNG